MLDLVPESHDDWQQDALCKGATRLFFGPPHKESKKARDEREAAAKIICAECVAIEPCRAKARENHEPFGVWGGETTADRISAGYLISTTLEGRPERAARKELNLDH